MTLEPLSGSLAALIDLGGPVIALLMCLSVVVLAVVLYKLWQFHALGVGRHGAIDRAVAARDAGARGRALSELDASPSHLAPVLRAAVRDDGNLKPRLTAMAEARLAVVERGFRLLDSIAQVAPLLGLFGTVLGMIDAFRALQEAGQAVDPAALAGGIWVALLTTAAGLAVAMPTALVLSWFEARAARERAKADEALEALFHPMAPASAEAPEAVSAFRNLAHGT
ncbi:MotA/TolQ/ExbB proton channel family protein [Roseibacterium sp. SDUM158017]|uniref:MotA/TolQ/ExbB proton channel family protein n=1 Tax=Roseicyclus salinarum TaxID=3036773 RepID=UPI002414DE8C|nr:MotA/TolQ/ExbB proton channel family protein [Roseibacterium sp. SDUM158017]MDG4649654.1 MotA/TolQ/ExbB proton channel family protein [Roseibacterium sp. SDUM158017]